MFESAQDIFAVMWGYLAALSNFFLVLQIKKLVHKKHVTAYENLMWFRTICTECKTVQSFIFLLKQSLYSYRSPLNFCSRWWCSSCEAAYRIELWEVFQILWAGLFSPRSFQKLSDMLFGALKKKTSSFPQYRVTKVNPLHIICHGGVFKINKMNYPI